MTEKTLARAIPLDYQIHDLIFLFLPHFPGARERGADSVFEVARILELTLRNIYSNLSASIGRIEAALREGKIEKARFRATAAAKAKTALLLSKTKGKRTASLIK